jgi:hypothetical protein
MGQSNWIIAKKKKGTWEALHLLIGEESKLIRAINFSQLQKHVLDMYNTNGFRTETMCDYYIAMKSMFLVAKLFFHSSISYASLTILLS